MSLSLADLRFGRPLLERTKGTYRVMFMGDSAGMPQGVKGEVGTAFMLEQSMNRLLPHLNVEVVNRSRGGMSFHTYALMTEEMIREVGPDLVVYFVCANDSEVSGLPLDAGLEETAKMQWGEGSALVEHLKASARRAAKAIKEKGAGVPVILFGINYLELPGAMPMDGVLREVAAEHGWKYATTWGRLTTLNFERLVATETDHHPSGYVHQVAVNELLLVLTRDLRVHLEKKGEIDVAVLVGELVGRMSGLPVQSGAFRAELVRVIDLLTQKVIHLKKSPRSASFAGVIGEMLAARAGLIEVYNRHDEVMAGVVRQRGHELGQVVLGEWPVELFQRNKLLVARVQDAVLRNLEEDGSLPFVEAGDEPPGDVEKELVQRVRETLGSLHALVEQQLKPLVSGRGMWPTPSGGRDIELLLKRVHEMGRDALVRAEERQDEIVGLIREAVDYGTTLLARAEKAIREGGVKRRVAMRSLDQYLGVLQLMGGGYFNVPQTRVTSKRLWEPAEWEGAEVAPQWTLTLEIKSEAKNAVGLWVEAVTPVSFYADYQQVGPELGKYTFTFPHCREFMLKLAASLPFTVGKTELSCGDVKTTNVNWVQAGKNFWRTTEVVKIST